MRSLFIFACILTPLVLANPWQANSLHSFPYEQVSATTTKQTCPPNKANYKCKQCTEKLEKLRTELKKQTNCQANLKKLQNTKNELEQDISELKQKVKTKVQVYEVKIQQVESRYARLKQLMKMLSLLLLTGGISGGAWYLRKRRIVKPKQLQAQSGAKVMRYFNGTLRPDVPAEIGTQFQQQLLDRVEQKQAWDTAQEQRVKQALEGLAVKGGNAHSQIAAFLTDFWCPLLACYEANTQHWTWFKEHFQAVCPAQWEVTIDTPNLVGKAFTEVINQTDNMLGQGQQVKAVVRPAITLQDEKGHRQAERKVWVELG